MVKVSVVIPNWNGWEMLEVCLKSLLTQTYKNFEVIVVDNNSQDDSGNLIKKYFPETKVIKLDRNYGFAKAVNIGIKNSLGEYIFLLNNDTKVDKLCINNLVKVLDQKEEVGMVASKMLNFYNPKIIDSAGDYIDAVGHANNIGYGQVDSEEYNLPGYVFLVNGGGSLYRRSLFDNIGYFDEDFFAYFEDVDLGLRAQLQGIKGWYEPSAVIYHIHKATSSRNKSYTEYLQFRNMTQTIIKNFPLYLLIKDLNFIKIMLVNLNTVRFLATHGYTKAALKAEVYILLNIPKLLIKRWIIQSNIKVSQRYIYENVKKKKITIFGLLKKGI